MPNRAELTSLLDLSQIDPALPAGHPFLGFDTFLNPKYYWTSSYTCIISVSGCGGVLPYRVEVSFMGSDCSPKRLIVGVAQFVPLALFAFADLIASTNVQSPELTL